MIPARLEMVPRWAAFAAIFFAKLAWADEIPIHSEQIEGIKERLEREIHLLQNQVRALEDRLRAREKRIALPDGSLRAGQDILVSGYIDTSYSFNLNRPEKAGTSAGTNVLRAYDSRDNNFDLNAFEIVMEKPARTEGGVGFRADLLHGMNAFLTDGAGLNFTSVSGAADEFDLQQAYGELELPIRENGVLDQVGVKVGKFVTLAGAEVLESHENWNVTRSLAWAFAEPVSHTGVRTTWNFWDGRFPVDLGINNGWDTVQETNNYKTLELGVGTHITETFNFYTAHYVGKESQTDVRTGAISDDTRYLTTVTLTWKTPLEKLKLMGSADFGNQRNAAAVVAAGSEPVTSESAQWHAYGLYAKYDIGVRTYLAYRGEVFWDDDAFRTAAITTPRTGRKLWGHTFTLDYRPYRNLITRLEYRLDISDAGVYDVSRGGATNGKDKQGTLATELTYLF